MAYFRSFLRALQMKFFLGVDFWPFLLSNFKIFAEFSGLTTIRHLIKIVYNTPLSARLTGG